ncbi:MAG: transglycosylase domain-containing protein [Moraxella sp.]|nr:transglycosylase domain-containing protein [Moraxella sp.]
MSQKFNTVRLISVLMRLVWAILALILILILAFPIGFYGMAMYLEPSLPKVDELKTMPLEMPLQIYTADEKLIAHYGNRYSLPVTYQELPKPLIQAFLAAEDDSFFEHSGISVKGLGRAITQIVTDDDQQTGGSTITQQVAKNYFLSPEQTIERKLTEMFLARRIEKEMTKDEIMTLYVNKIYLGQGAYGIKAGAKRYYSKSLNKLTLAEMAMLAGLPKAPSDFNPVVNPERALERRNWILGRMLAEGFIDKAAHDTAVASPIGLNMYQETPDISMPDIAELARAALVERYGESVMHSGWKVQLTINSTEQEAAEKALRDGLNSYDKRHGWRGVEAESGNLDNFKSFLGMHPAQVTKVNANSIQVQLKSGESVTVPWSGMNWARRYYSANRVGGGYGSPAQMVKVGNIIRVSQNSDSGTWRMVAVPVVQGALVSLNPEDGAVRAMVGGFHFDYSKFNRAAHGYRQPGSIIKPLIFAAALETKKYTPGSMVSDQPLRIGSWRPKNADGKYYGDMSVAHALAVSRNLPAIRLLLSVGMAEAHIMLDNFGLEQERLPDGPALALGAADATPLQMATAYTAFINGGHRVQPYFISHIYNFNNELVFQANPAQACAICFNNDLEARNAKLLEDFEKAKLAPTTDVDTDGKKEGDKDKDKANQEKASEEMPSEQPAKPMLDPNADASPAYDRLRPAKALQYQVAAQAPRILSPQTAYDMATMLRGVIRGGTGKKALALGRSDVGGKTGTTNQAKDAWFAGVHPTSATVVWVGFDNPSTLGASEYGGVAALPIWVNFMRHQLAGVPVQWVSTTNESKAETQKQKIINITDETPMDELPPELIDDGVDIPEGDGETIPEGDGE